MSKRLIYIKWATIAVLVIIVILWLSYFSECVYKSERHLFDVSNDALDFLKWVAKRTNGALVVRPTLFDSEFYLLDFSALILFFEAIYVILLVAAGILNKNKRTLYAIIICISLVLFFGLFRFLNATQQLFIPA